MLVFQRFQNRPTAIEMSARPSGNKLRDFGAASEPLWTANKESATRRCGFTHRPTRRHGHGSHRFGPDGREGRICGHVLQGTRLPPPVPLPRHRARRRGHRRRVSRARHDATLSTALTSPTSSTRHRRTETGGSRSSTPPRMPSSACTATRRWCPTASTPIPSPSRYHKTEPPSGAGASRRSSPRTAAPRRRRSSPRSTKDKTNTTYRCGSSVSLTLRS